jgi:hypothetical protein
MRAALQIIRRQADALQPTLNPCHVLRFSIVGGAGQGDFGVAEGEALSRTGLDQGQRLQGLDRRAWVDGALGVSPRGDDGAGGVSDGDDAAVAAFHHLAAGDFDEYRVDRVHGPYVPPRGFGWQGR